jgi:hypothetical protein
MVLFLVESDVARIYWSSCPMHLGVTIC